MKEILHLHTSLKYSCGITRYLLTVFKSESFRKNNILMVRRVDDEELFVYNSINVEFFRQTASVFSLFSDLVSLVRVINRNKIRIVHSHHRYFDFLAYLLRKYLRYKTITTVHSIVYGNKYLSYKSQKLIAVSQAVKNHLQSCFSKADEKIIVLRNGIDPSFYSIQLNNQRRAKIFTLGFIGRLSKEKGTDILLITLRELIREKFEFRVIIAGSGELESDADKFQDDFPEFCEFRGSVKDISRVYSEIDLLLLPSRVDPFPYTILECGLFKVPVIASSVDGIPEMIEDKRHGQLIPSESISELKSAIIWAAANRDEIKNRSENLHKRVISEFLVQHHLIKLSEAYRSLLKK